MSLHAAVPSGKSELGTSTVQEKVPQPCFPAHAAPWLPLTRKPIKASMERWPAATPLADSWILTHGFPFIAQKCIFLAIMICIDMTLVQLCGSHCSPCL